MFQIGNKIFYPMHGGGIIEGIDEKEIFGKTQLYYVVNILHRKMKVMIPIDNMERLGLRQIVNSEKLDDMLTNFHDGETELVINDTQRHRRNMEKIKSGSIYEGAEVIRDLVRANSKKKLGIAEKKLLENALQILISEVVLIKEIPHDKAAELLDQVINLH
jgi:CarD family transcriptional regulator